MIEGLTRSFDFHAAALQLRSERTRVLASNIANADTPNYRARDFDFGQALAQATGNAPAASATTVRTASAHLASLTGGPTGVNLQYRTPAQSSLDANSVDMDMERAAFADNSVRYEAGLRFINSQIRTLLTSITGQ